MRAPSKQRINKLWSDSVRPMCSPLSGESVDVWRFFSRQAHAILDIAARVHAGNPGTNEDWLLVLDHGLPGHHPTSLMEVNRTFLLEAIRGWMSFGSVHLWIWDLHGKIGLAGADLFGKLALELALAVSRSKGLWVCSFCGQQYQTNWSRLKAARIIAPRLLVSARAPDVESCSRGNANPRPRESALSASAMQLSWLSQAGV